MPATTPVPAAVDLLRAFVNTRNLEDGIDGFASPTALGGWLVARGLLAAPARVRGADHARALALREALRATLLTHHDPGGDLVAAPELDRLVADLPLRLTFPAGAPRLVAAEGGPRGALAAVVAAVQQSVADGSWSRLKACPADDCQWAFYDASKNRSRTWCSMEVCGNRAKTRTYRSRHGS